MTNIKKNHPYIIEQLKERKYTETRIIVSNQKENTQRVFITNLHYKIKSEKIENLYLKRWEIEKKYHTLKNKMKLENITGKSTIYVYQDFWAQILIYNMINYIINSSNNKLEKKQKKINME